MNVAPHYDDISGEPISCSACRVNGALKVFLLPTISCVTFLSQWEQYNKWLFTVGLLFVLENFLSVSVLVVGVLRVTFGNVEVWRNQAIKMKIVKRRFEEFHITSTRTNKFLISGVIAYGITYMVLVYTKFKELTTLALFLSWFSHHFCFVYALLVVFVYLYRIIEVGRIYRGLHVFLGRNGYQAGNQFLEDVISTADVWIDMYEIVQNLNKSYGWQLFLIILDLSSFILRGLNVLVLESLGSNIPYVSILYLSVTCFLVVRSTHFQNFLKVLL